MFTCKHCGKRARTTGNRNCPTSPNGGRHEPEDQGDTMNAEMSEAKTYEEAKQILLERGVSMNRARNILASVRGKSGYDQVSIGKDATVRVDCGDATLFVFTGV